MEAAGIINEIWRSVSGYANYQVSNIGRVRNTKTGRILQPCDDSDGYHIIHLYINGSPKTTRIHQLVAKEFIDNPQNKPCIDHIDRDTKNNCTSNLRWSTYSENSMNKRKGSKNTSSVYKGVSWHKKAKKWNAYIQKDNHKYNIGCFTDEKDAARAYNTKAVELFGEYAHINYISDDDDDDDDDEETVVSGDPLNMHYI